MPIPPTPTKLSNASSPSLSRQNMLVAGTTAGAIALVFLVFAAIFFRVRQGQRQQERTAALAREERKGKGAGSIGMLDGEDFPESRASTLRGPPIEVDYRLPSFEYHLALPAAFTAEPEPTTAETAPAPAVRPRLRPGASGSAPFLFPARAASSGSAFHEEVWPPPRQESVFVDPLLHVRGEAPSDELERIVTDVMGSRSDGGGEVAPLVPPSPTSSSPSSDSESELGEAAPLQRRSSEPAIVAAGSAEKLPPAYPPLTRAPWTRELASTTAAYRGIRPPALRSSSSFSSTPTLPRSTHSHAATISTAEDDLSWPPTPGGLPVFAFEGAGTSPPPPVAYPGVNLSNAKTKGVRLVRPTTGDGAPQVRNWLERTPRRPGTAPGPLIAPRAASEGH